MASALSCTVWMASSTSVLVTDEDGLEVVDVGAADQLFVRGGHGFSWEGRAADAGDEGRQQVRADEPADRRRVVGVDPRRGPEGERDDHAGQQLGRRPDVAVGQEARQVGPAQGVGGSNTRSSRSKAKCGSDELGLVGEDDPVSSSSSGSRSAAPTPTTSRSSSVSAASQLGVPLVEQAAGLVLEQDLDDAVLAAGEHPVDRGPADPGLAGDVVERRLADAPAGDAADRGVRRAGRSASSPTAPVGPRVDLRARSRCPGHAETLRTNPSHRPA